MTLRYTSVLYHHRTHSAYAIFFKRLFDISVSLVVLTLALPLLALVIVLLTIANRGTPFFTQLRPGQWGNPFRIIKFKTMNDRRDRAGNLLPDAERITFVGNLLRKTSIDELPQLINVLQGDMSLIGPRPLLYKYLPLYDQEQKRRHEVKPGITGLAQVSGRNGISWRRKFDYDICYVDHLSFRLDVKILLLTAQKVVLREGVNQCSDRPMEPFNGRN